MKTHTFKEQGINWMLISVPKETKVPVNDKNLLYKILAILAEENENILF